MAVYSLLAQSPCEPQIVLIRGNARHFMLLTEAAIGAGINPNGIMPRPTCAFLQETLLTGRATPSFACIGNRVHTGMNNDELYYAIPGLRIAEVVAVLEKIVAANQALESLRHATVASPIYDPPSVCQDTGRATGRRGVMVNRSASWARRRAASTCAGVSPRAKIKPR